jgi:hypothetical protein
MKNRTTGWETMRRGRDILEAGIQSRSLGDHHDVERAGSLVTRAVVLAVYFVDEDTRNEWVKGKQRSVLCDVRTYGRVNRVLTKVPVLQRTRGLWDEDTYIPRASSKNLDGGPLKADGAGMTPAEKMDGDHVLIAFLDGDPSQPVVLPYCLAHPESNNKAEKAHGRRRRIRHSGVLIEWSEDGDLTIDATEAAKSELGAKGIEQPNSGTTGKITLVTQDGAGKKTSIRLNNLGQILIGADPEGAAADEPLVLGNQIKSQLEALYAALAAHTHAGVTPGVGVSGPPGPPELAKFTTQFPQALPNALSDFIFGKKST